MATRQHGLKGKPPGRQRPVDRGENLLDLCRKIYPEGCHPFVYIALHCQGLEVLASLATSKPGNRHLRRAVRVSLMVFVAAGLVAWLSHSVMSQAGFLLTLAVQICIILLGVTADIIGTAITAAQETPFHAMAAKRMTGARQALWMVKNADRVSNFFEDIVGDIAGTVSGAAAATVAVEAANLLRAAGAPGLLERATDYLAVAMVAALAVGGKAAGKGLAIAHATSIVHRVGVALAWLQKVFPWIPPKDKPHRQRGRTSS